MSSSGWGCFHVNEQVNVFDNLLLLISLSEVFHEIHKSLDIIKFDCIVHWNPYSSNGPENKIDQFCQVFEHQ